MINQLFTRAKNIILHGSYIPTEYYISEEKELVYIPIAKVACTTLKIATLADQDDYNLDKDSYMGVHKNASNQKYLALPDRCQGYYKFAFVRNPFDRLVSCYEDKVKTSVQHHGQYYFATNYNRMLIKRLFGNEFTPDMTFDDFVKLVHKIPDFLADGHFKSQYSILYKKNQLTVDHIGKFENIENDWETIAQLKKLPSIDKRNTSVRKSWEDYYTSKKIIAMVIDRYKNDFKYFDYDTSINK